MSNTLPGIPIDDDIADADWIKRGRWDLPTTVGPFLAALHPAGESLAAKRAAVSNFMRLPAAAMMPASLRRSLRQARLL